MLMCRCDTDHAGFITSVIDERDHAWVVGVTKPVEPLTTALARALKDGADYKQAQQDWITSAGLSTFDEAVAAHAATAPDIVSSYQQAVKAANGVLSIQARRSLAEQHLGKELYSTLIFDWDLARTPEGSYRFRPTVDAVISRAVLAAGLGEITWARMDFPVPSDIDAFHTGVRAVYPDRKFGFGYTGGYDWLKNGWTPDQVKEFPWESSKKYGIVWHVQPIWALQGQRRAVQDFGKLFQEGGIASYMKHVQAKELKTTYPGLLERDTASSGLTNGTLSGDDLGYARLRFSGAYLADALLETATMGIFGEDQTALLMGKGLVKGPTANRIG